MRHLLPLSCLALSVFAAGCDVIYERPEPQAVIDFGEPYAVGIEARNAANGTLAPPYISSDNQLVADVTYPSDCVASRFVVRFEARDIETADVWMVHRADAGSCEAEAGEAEADVAERLTLTLPASAERFPRIVLLTPDQRAVVLDRFLD